jgi:Na+/alanine symporter
MALPNILGLVLLSSSVKDELIQYEIDLKSGKLDKEVIK